MILIECIIVNLSSLPYFITHLLMEDIIQAAQFSGNNFRGSLQMSQDKLTMEVVQYKKGAVYVCQITIQILKKQFKRYLIFQDIIDLFDQLLLNKNLEIIDQNAIILPVCVFYRNRAFELKVQISLTPKKFNSQSEKMQALYQKIQLLSEKTKLLQLFAPQLIRFRGDETNSSYKTFQVTGQRIKMLGNNCQHIFNHRDTLPKKGVFYYQFKVIKAVNKQIMYGICSKHIKENTAGNAFMNTHFMGLYFYGLLYGDNKKPQVAPGYNIVQGQSVCKVVIDMNNKLISWYLNNEFVYRTQIREQIAKCQIYPMLTLYTNGDIVEFINN